MLNHPALKESQSRRIFDKLGVALYVHYPFCVHKCPYCDFASIGVGEDRGRDQLYVAALINEFERRIPFLQGAKLCSVYIGGGTPSLCEPQLWHKLLAFVKPYLLEDAEISIEVNPGTVSLEKLRALHLAGFNRISLGVQSFNDLALKRIGRIHDRDTALQACKWALDCFEDVNLDIMHGLPKQSLQEGLADLQQLIEFKPSHLSWYELTIEEDTAFGRRPPVLPDEDVLSDMEEQGFALLDKAGYEHYEVSGYNLGGKMRCIHNQNYWLYGDYLGIGAGAHQKLSVLTSKFSSELTKLNAALAKNSTESTNAAQTVSTNSAQTVPTDFAPTEDANLVFNVHINTEVAAVSNLESTYEWRKHPELAADYLHSKPLVDSAQLFTIYRHANTESYQDYLSEQLTLAHLHPTSTSKELLDLAKAFQLKSTAVGEDGVQLKVLSSSSEQMSVSYEQMVLGQAVAREQIPFEFMLNRLRLWLDPFSMQDAEFRMGFKDSSLEPKVQQLMQQGLFENSMQQGYAYPWIKPTDLGRRMLNDIIYEFLEE